jgi:hypothetical protein
MAVFLVEVLAVPKNMKLLGEPKMKSARNTSEVSNLTPFHRVIFAPRSHPLV